MVNNVLRCSSVGVVPAEGVGWKHSFMSIFNSQPIWNDCSHVITLPCTTEDLQLMAD